MRQALPHADLVRVGVDDHVRAPVARDGDEGDVLVGVVAQLVGALLAEREAHRLALAQLARSLWRAQGRTTAQDQDQLLVGVVEVVRVGGLA
jgi:hypothetical protein